MMTLRERMIRGARLGTVTSMGGVAGISICGISIFIGGIERTLTEGIVIRRVPRVPGLKRSWFGFFSGVTVIVRVFLSRTTVSDTSPVSFFPRTRVMSLTVVRDRKSTRL